MPGEEKKFNCRTSHHHACDCREAKFAQMEKENARLREALQEIVDWAHVEPIAGQDLTDYKAKARNALGAKDE